MSKNPNKAELDRLVKEVGLALGEEFRKAEEAEKARLAKAADEGPPPPPPAGPPPEGEPPPGGAGEGSAPPAGPEGPPPEGEPPPGEGGPVDQAQLEQIYAQMSDEELKTHYLALKAVIVARAGGGAPGGPEGAAPAPTGVSGGGSPPPPPMGKSEFIGPPNGGPIQKSETDLKVEALEKSIKGLVDVFEKVLTRPQRKAITGIEWIAKSEDTATKSTAKPVEQLTRAEIKARLNEVAKRTDLEKSDRSRITQYFYGDLSVDEIKDLLE